jgi:nicotinamide riboside kinase
VFKKTFMFSKNIQMVYHFMRGKIMKKIAIVGVHSAGKTSLAYNLAAHFKMHGINVKLIHESVRENCPFPINADANLGTCLWNFHTQFLNELEAEAQGYELAICDRSVLDTFVYFHAVNPETAITRAAIRQASEWLPTYDLLVCLEPVSHIEPQDDGIRSTDRGYQELINKGFKNTLSQFGINIADRILYASSEDVFDENKRIRLLSKVEARMGSSLTQ